MHQSDWGWANRIGFVEGWEAWKARLKNLLQHQWELVYIGFAAGGYVVQNTDLISKPPLLPVVAGWFGRR